jgi:predicted oxidoreductase
MTVSRVHFNEKDSFSRLVVGFWRLSKTEERSRVREILEVIETCLAKGITTFDHADIYGGYTCESLFGWVLAEKPELRDRMQLMTKCGIKLISPNRPAHKVKSYDTSKRHILMSVENSLSNLRTGYIDLLLIHRPDPLMNADEVAETFRDLKTVGKVKHFGVSNFSPDQFNLLQSRLDFPLQTNQVEFSVLNTQALYDGTLNQCQLYRIPPMAWSPFGGGALFTSSSEKAEQVRYVLNAVGNELGGASIGQVALAWLLKHPSGVMPVLGSGRIDRIIDAAQSEKLEMSREQWFRILAVSEGREVP